MCLVILQIFLSQGLPLTNSLTKQVIVVRVFLFKFFVHIDLYSISILFFPYIVSHGTDTNAFCANSLRMN
jgi:hypothetical protein